MIHHVPRQLKQPQSTFLQCTTWEYIVFPGEPQDFLVFPLFDPQYQQAPLTASHPSPARMLGLS